MNRAEAKDDPATFGKIGDPRSHTFFLRLEGTDYETIEVAPSAKCAIEMAQRKTPGQFTCRRAHPTQKPV